MVVGDVVFARAVELARRSGRAEVVRLMLAAARAVSAAELLHTHRRGDLGLSAREYLHIARGKTASLFALAADLGALLSAAGGPVRRQFYRYGRSLGLAYQLADDCRDLVLDSVGGEGAVGLVHGCVTLPLICYLERCTREERGWVASVVRSRDGGGAAELQRRVLRSGACRRVREVACQWLTAACGALEALPPSEAKSALLEAAAHVRGSFDELGQ
jgi:octaprenyl-diphosphate synthase